MAYQQGSDPIRNDRQITTLLRSLGRSRFRSRFHLGAKERHTVGARGLDTIRTHATEIIDKRLAAARPANDGRQTPWRGHPVFVAQHATATCCRGCLQRVHGINNGHTLTDAEREYVVRVLCQWIEHDMDQATPDSPNSDVHRASTNNHPDTTPTLF